MKYLVFIIVFPVFFLYGNYTKATNVVIPTKPSEQKEKVISKPKNLPVPFTVQAPKGDWSAPWHEACEEATLVMVEHFYTGNALDVDTAARDILSIVDIQKNVLGYYEDTDAKDIDMLASNFFSFETIIKEKPTLDDIKKEIDEGRPVIALAHGKDLKNPNFRNGGPDYHVFVISGYDDTKQEFITQEPGTRRGKNYVYSYTVIMNSLRNYVHPKKTKTGSPVVLFTTNKLSKSVDTDGDKDGLTKKEELKHKTNLFVADTDNDGYSDGAEIASGYNPIVNERSIQSGMLVRNTETKRIYMIEKDVLRYIPSPEVLKKYQSGPIKNISPRTLERYEVGPILD